ncbi:hypothetical protein [Dyadobacter jejuensis]|nr:hypothetical protein [Dyadobacter jejuensis]
MHQLFTGSHMARVEKLLLKLLSGNSDNNFSIDELKIILLQLGFYEIKGAGSHTLYKMDGIDDLINIQSVKGGQAKAYQIRQIRNIIIKHKLVKL